MSNGFQAELQHHGIRDLPYGMSAPLRPTILPKPARCSAGAGDPSRRLVWLGSILKQDADGPICLSEIVATAVFRHVATNLDARFASDAAQILIITGPFGCGKTVNTRDTLRRMGCVVIELPASGLESHLSNIPAERIRASYCEASEKQMESGTPHVVLIEDIHMAFSLDERTTRTKNIDMAVAALMEICDHPTSVGKATTQRIPIIATANDLSKVYGALIRPGRTRVVAMEPSESERTRVVAHIFRALLEPAQVTELLAARPNWSIASFRQLKAELLNQVFDQLYGGRNAQQVLQQAMGSRGTSDSLATAMVVSKHDLEQAIAAIDREAQAKRDFTDNPTST